MRIQSQKIFHCLFEFYTNNIIKISIVEYMSNKQRSLAIIYIPRSGDMYIRADRPLRTLKYAFDSVYSCVCTNALACICAYIWICTWLRVFSCFLLVFRFTRDGRENSCTIRTLYIRQKLQASEFLILMIFFFYILDNLFLNDCI